MRGLLSTCLTLWKHQFISPTFFDILSQTPKFFFGESGPSQSPKDERTYGPWWVAPYDSCFLDILRRMLGTIFWQNIWKTSFLVFPKMAVPIFSQEKKRTWRYYFRKVLRSSQWLPQMNHFGIFENFSILRHTHKSINKCHPEFSLHLKSWICMGHINKNHTSETHLPRHSFDTFAVNWSTHLSWQIHVSHTHCSRKNPIWEKKELHSTASGEARRVSVQVPLTTAPGKRFSSIVNGLSEGKATPTSLDCMSGVSKKTVKLPRDPAGLL